MQGKIFHTCGQRGAEINNVRSAEQQADFLTKPLRTEACSFHRTCDELVAISYADLFLFCRYFGAFGFCAIRVGVFGMRGIFFWKVFEEFTYGVRELEAMNRLENLGPPRSLCLCITNPKPEYIHCRRSTDHPTHPTYACSSLSSNNLCGPENAASTLPHSAKLSAEATRDVFKLIRDWSKAACQQSLFCSIYV